MTFIKAEPDMLLLNGNVITLDDQFSIQRAIAVRCSRIQAVGTDEQLSQPCRSAYPCDRLKRPYGHTWNC